jgi:hypothetical protein
MDTTILLSAVVGGLVGSLVTIVLTKVTSIVVQGREHKLSLQSSFFERKITAAENAMSQWHATASLLSGIVSLYERMTSKEREFEYELFRVTNDALISQWQEISQTAHDVANTVILYFDTDDNSFINAEVIRNLLDRLSSIRSLDISLKFALDMFEKFKGTRKEEAAWNEVERIMEEYRSNLIDITAIFGQVQTEMIDFLRAVRKEVRRYEPR